MRFLLILMLLPVFGMAQNSESRLAFLAINGKRSELKLNKLSYQSGKQTDCDAQAVLSSIGKENKTLCDGCLSEELYHNNTFKDLLQQLTDVKTTHMSVDQTGITVSVLIIDSSFYAVIRTYRPF
jgi:hypothetical protein